MNLRSNRARGLRAIVRATVHAGCPQLFDQLQSRIPTSARFDTSTAEAPVPHLLASSGSTPLMGRSQLRRFSMNQTMLTMVRFTSGRRRYGVEHPSDLAKGINEVFSRGELLLAPIATYNVLLYFINLSLRKVAQNVLL